MKGLSRVGRTSNATGVIALTLLAGCATTDRTAERAHLTALVVKAAAGVPALADDPRFKAATAVIARLPRERFIPKKAAAWAYLPFPLQIGWDQTISDPYIMAVMTAAAKVGRGSRVLEIGTGSGYQAAMLAELGASVSSIEIVPQLARRSARTLRAMGYRTISVRSGDGFAGWPNRAPFDAIMVTAGAARVPKPLLDQLRGGGRLVMPVGVSTTAEQLLVYTKRQDGSFDICRLGWAMFVPLTGRGQTQERAGLIDRTKPPCYGAEVT